MDASVESECVVLEERFQNILSDLRTSFSGWEDFTLKASRLHTALKSTAAYSTAFLESFQRLADTATSSRGSTRDIGSAMTRLCMRHRNIDGRLKGFTSAIMDSLVVPLQERMEDWKRAVVALDRDHAKEHKRASTDVRKSSAETQRLQKKLAKKTKIDCRADLELAIRDGNEKLAALRVVQKNAVRAAMAEERGRLCLFISCLKPVMDEEVAMLTEVTHIQEILQSLCLLAGDPDSMVIGDQSGDLIVGKKSEEVAGATVTMTKQDDDPMSRAGAVTPGSPGSEGSLTGSSGGSVGSVSQLYSPSRRILQQQQYQQQQHQFQQQHQRAQSQIFTPRCFASDRDSDFMSSSQSLAITDMGAKSIGRGISESATVLPTAAGPHVYTGGVMIRQKENPAAAHVSRPHTISSAYERSYSRPTIMPETYLQPCSLSSGGNPGPAAGNPSTAAPPYLRTQSYTVARASDSGHYAVPCVFPPRKQQAGKVADIYARPALVPAGSKAGTYRTPSNRPVPVATPTVPDFEPAFPAAGYVNMNQLASLALQQQQMNLEEARKKDSTPNTPEQLSDSAITPVADPAEDMLGKRSGVEKRRTIEEPFARKSEVDLDFLADRLAGSRMSGVEKYPSRTNLTSSSASLTQFAQFTSQLSPARVLSHRVSFSDQVGGGRGVEGRGGAPGRGLAGEQALIDEWDSDRESPVFN